MEVKNLSYKNIIEDVSYIFANTRIYGIFSKNIVQSTVFLELIAGLREATHGLVKTYDKKVYMIFSNSDDQIFNETVEEEILYGINSSEVAIEEICEKLDLDLKFLQKKCTCLNKSEKALVVLASMLAANPDIILIDNFLGNLDYKTRKQIMEVLKRLQFDDHKQLIIADRNIDFLFEFMDVVVILDNEVVLSGNKYEIFKKTEILKTIDVDIPKYISFSDLVLKDAQIEIGYRDRITDIMKDVYDNVKREIS